MPAHCPTCNQPIPEPGQRIDQIQVEVASYYLIPYAALVGPDKRRKYAQPRQVAYLLARELTDYSIARIARVFRRDHTTVTHGIMHIERLARREASLERQLAELRGRLTSKHA